MRRAACALVALAASLLVTGPARASGCPLVTDPVGDVGPFFVPLDASRNLDVVSADVATGATTVVGVVRTRSLDLGDPTLLVPRWAVSWDIGSVHYGLVAERKLGDLEVTGYMTGPAGYLPASVAIDESAATVTITISRSAIAELATPGAELKRFGALASDPLTFTTDFAEGPVDGTYVDQSAGCITAA